MGVLKLEIPEEVLRRGDRPLYWADGGDPGPVAEGQGEGLV